MSRDGFLSHQAAVKEVYTSGRLRHGDPQVGASDVPISLNLWCESHLPPLGVASAWIGLLYLHFFSTIELM